MIDYFWHGPLEAVAAAIANRPNVIGPRMLDGVAYVCVRANDPLETPPGLSKTGLELSAVVLGVWA